MKGKGVLERPTELTMGVLINRCPGRIRAVVCRGGQGKTFPERKEGMDDVDEECGRAGGYVEVGRGDACVLGLRLKGGARSTAKPAETTGAFGRRVARRGEAATRVRNEKKGRKKAEGGEAVVWKR